jgi:hypothetical protein
MQDAKTMLFTFTDTEKLASDVSLRTEDDFESVLLTRLSKKCNKIVNNDVEPHTACPHAWFQILESSSEVSPREYQVMADLPLLN